MASSAVQAGPNRRTSISILGGGRSAADSLALLHLRPSRAGNALEQGGASILGAGSCLLSRRIDSRVARRNCGQEIRGCGCFLVSHADAIGGRSTYPFYSTTSGNCADREHATGVGTISAEPACIPSVLLGVLSEGRCAGGHASRSLSL